MDKDEEWRWKEELKEQVMVRRERIIARMEKERGSKVVTLVHRMEPWIKKGDYPAIEIEDSEKVLLNIKRAGKRQPIDLILHTPGGIALANPGGRGQDRHPRGHRRAVHRRGPGVHPVAAQAEDEGQGGQEPGGVPDWRVHLA